MPPPPLPIPMRVTRYLAAPGPNVPVNVPVHLLNVPVSYIWYSSGLSIYLGQGIYCINICNRVECTRKLNPSWIQLTFDIILILYLQILTL